MMMMMMMMNLLPNYGTYTEADESSLVKVVR